MVRPGNLDRIRYISRRGPSPRFRAGERAWRFMGSTALASFALAIETNATSVPLYNGNILDR